VPQVDVARLEEWAVVSDGHRTSSIQRPRPNTPAVVRADADATRLSDFTRPITKDKRLVTRSGYRLLIAGIAVIVVTALMAALFVLPIKSWYRQRDDLAERQRQLSVLDAANAQLAQQVGYLQTPDGIQEAAREEIGYGGADEKRVTVLPAPAAPLTLPAGWPYDGVGQIIAVRAAQAAAATAAAATTLAPPTVAPAPAGAPAPADPAATTPPADASGEATPVTDAAPPTTAGAGTDTP
jgi:cell division protein FtsB